MDKLIDRLFITVHRKFHDQGLVIFFDLPDPSMLHHRRLQDIAVDIVTFIELLRNDQFQALCSTALVKGSDGKDLQGGIITVMVNVALGDILNDEFGTETFVDLLGKIFIADKVVDAVTAENDLVADLQLGLFDLRFDMVVQAAGLSQYVGHVFIVHVVVNTEQFKRTVVALKIDV